MPKYFAFLRGINVGGSHVVKMDRLPQIFEAFGFSGVETFIASGNVIFESTSKNPKSLEKRVEAGLREALGYDVATFIRTEAELLEIANYQPFSKSQLETAVALNIVLVGEALGKDVEQRTVALKTDLDDLHVNGREIYWLCRGRQSDSTLSNTAFNKTLGQPGTIRGLNTVKKRVAKYVRSLGDCD